MVRTALRSSLVVPFSLLAALAAASPAIANPLPTLTPSLPAALSQHPAALVSAPAQTQLMHLSVALPLRDRAGLDALLADIYNPQSPNFRHYLSVAEFTRRFGPTAADYQAAVAFFAGSGMTIRSVAANRGLIDLEASVADAERVFHVKMGLYRHPTENRLFIAPDREPTLDLSVPITQVIGLDNFVLPTPRLVRAADVNAKGPGGSGPNGQLIGSDVRTAYYGHGKLTGAGQSLGLMELEGYELSDIQLYFSTFGPPLTTNVVGISTDGTSLGCGAGCNDGEQALDVEYAVSMAPGLSQVQVYVGSTPESVMNRMVSDNTSKQLSTSWGWGDHLDVDEPIMKEMAAQGQSYLTASGDYSSLKRSGPWPEEDPFITAVGGTSLSTKRPGGPWRAENGWWGSAGGPSLDPRAPIASYQIPFINPANAGSYTLRNVPDIAGDANTNNMLCAQGHCAGGWGGTSFASPIWAGFIALVNEEAEAKGKPPVGFLNPALYGIGASVAYAQSFHDEVKGKSGVFNSVYGFDLVTGLGSPKGQVLINELASGVYQ